MVDLNVRMKTKTLAENTEVTLCDLGWGDDFLDMTQRHIIKEKNQ